MNVGIRRVGIAVTILVLVLVGQLTYLQIIAADRLENDPRNVRNLIRDFSRPRGDIITADGQVVAESVPVDDEFEFQRLYPEGPLYAQVSGYQSFVVGNTGVEKEYNDDLVGRSTQLQLGNVRDLLLGKEQTGTVVLTLESAVQQAARDALGDQPGSVVALDPSTGGVLAMYSNPTYDPNLLAGHDALDVDANFEALSTDPAKPDLPRTYRERYPPGSSFKTVTAGTALDDGVVTPETEFPSVSSITLPLTDGVQLENFGGQSCGGDLIQSFTRSCNTTFAEIGLELGNSFVAGMRGFGVGESPPIDLDPGAVTSVGPPTSEFDHDDPEFALAGIGQGQVAVTPLEMALVASGVANGGVINKPHVAAEILDVDDVSVKRIGTDPWKRAMSSSTALTVSEMMVSVVENGTGGAAAIPGISVAGKTGTAQTGVQGVVHAWFIAFAPVEDPQVAVAVIVEGGGDAGSEATGGEVAAPIARAVIEAARGVQ
ncbi:MAG: peptidoglycan D,D-transpeptidase FtsI family protein [Acidimicrobiia bacterium]